MAGILQSLVGNHVTIWIKTDAAVNDEGTTAQLDGILMPHPSGARQAFALMRQQAVPPEARKQAAIVGGHQSPETISVMVSFEPEVVAMVVVVIPSTDEAGAPLVETPQA